MFSDCNGVKIFYAVRGSGKPLILLHGNGEDHSIFDRAAAVLEKRFTVYMPDTRCHGQSGDGQLTYELMADDVAALITGLGMENPTVFGFSDGGITALLLALRRPGLAGRLICAGANIYPGGLKPAFLLRCRTEYFFSRDKLLKLMLTQPHITPGQLAGIDIPVTLLAGQHDLIRPAHTRLIAASIPKSRLHLLAGESHCSYVAGSDRFIEYVCEEKENG